MISLDCTKRENKLINFIIEELELVAVTLIIAFALFLIAKSLIPRSEHKMAVERFRKQSIAEDWIREKKWIYDQRQKETEEARETKKAKKVDELEIARRAYLRTLAEERQQRLDKINRGQKERKEKA